MEINERKTNKHDKLHKKLNDQLIRWSGSNYAWKKKTTAVKIDTKIPAIRCGTAVWSLIPADLLSLGFATAGDDVPFGAAGVAVDGLGSAKMAASGEFAGNFRSSA